MIFEEITLDNYGTYKGSSSIQLSTDPSRPVILVGGENGCGKTTLLDAFQLVLFGSAARCSNRGKLSYETYLARCINRKARQDEPSRIRLIFHFFDAGERKSFRIERAWQRKGKRIHESFWAYQWINGNWKYDRTLSQNWGDYIESFFPSQVAPFFFFDGEKIEALADFENSAPLIHSAIHSLLGLNLVGKLEADLILLEKRKIRELAGQDEGETLDKLEAELEELNIKINALNSHEEALKQKRDQCVKELNEVELIFRQSGGALFEQRTRMEEQLSSRRIRLAEQEERLRGLAAGIAPLLMVRSLLTDIKTQAEAENQAKQEDLLCKMLLERDFRLFEHLKEAATSPLVIDEIKHYLETDRAARRNVADIDRYLELSESGHKALELLLAEGLDETARIIPQELKKTALARSEVEELERALAGVPEESKVFEIIADRTRHQEALHRINGQLVENTEEIERTKRQREHKSNELRRELARTAELRFEGKDSRRMVQYATKVRGTLETYREKVLIKHLEHIEELVLKSFKNLLRKETLIGQIRIHRETCEMKILAESGEEIHPERLSAGERQLLATALLWGICQAAGKPLPTVIDTPLGRLDTSHRTNLVNNYFPYASHQVLLLSTNEEIVGKYYDQLRPYISRTCLLGHSDIQGGTTVKQGYFN